MSRKVSATCQCGNRYSTRVNTPEAECPECRKAKASSAARGEVVRAETVTASGTSEGARKGWEHRTREGALGHLRDLRKQGFRGRATVEHDPRAGVYFIRKHEGELAERKPQKQITPYDKEIRRMKKFGTRDMHGALTDAIYDDQQAREEFEGDSPGASWEDAAADLAHNYLLMHGIRSGIRGSAQDADLDSIYASLEPEAVQAAGTTEDTTMNNHDNIRATGTSEGAKKGWQSRTGHAYKVSVAANAFDARLHNGEFGEVTSHRLRQSAEYHEDAAVAHEHAKHAVNEEGAEVSDVQARIVSAAHERHTDHHRSMAARHSREAERMDRKTKASDTTTPDTIHCRDFAGTVIATDKEWAVGQDVNFMWMPSGVHTICAGFRNGSIELTVQCDESTADAVQSSLNAWREERPKQEPFGCVEHREHEASVRVGATHGFSWKDDGVYLAAEPTLLGAQNVNGKVHRSWSPSFTTDADYAQAKEIKASGKTMLVFPEGVRGSRSNPARITGVDFCVGTLTNKPAFHAMSPVKCSESVQATWSDAARQAALESRRRHGIEGAGHHDTPEHYEKWANHHEAMVSCHARHEDAAAPDSREEENHGEARQMHHAAAVNYRKAASRLRAGNHEQAKHFLGIAERYSVDATEGVSPLQAIYASLESQEQELEAINAEHGMSELEQIYASVEPVMAVGTSEGVRQSWVARRAHAQSAATAAGVASEKADTSGRSDHHHEASRLHDIAAGAYQNAVSEMKRSGFHNNDATLRQTQQMVNHHDMMRIHHKKEGEKMIPYKRGS